MSKGKSMELKAKISDTDESSDDEDYKINPTSPDTSKVHEECQC